MGKTVYSIVLSQNVIAAIDTLAVQKGLSRSGLINHILAEYSGLSTPEHQMRALAHTVRQHAAGGGLRAEVSVAGSLTLYTSLQFKYNPSLRYQLDFSKTNAGQLGELRVGLRSQNEDLLGTLSAFFELWCHLEHKHLSFPPGPDCFSVEGPRFRRSLRRPDALTEALLGTAAADYITRMDGCLKTFFTHLEEPTIAVRKTEKEFIDALSIIELSALL